MTSDKATDSRVDKHPKRKVLMFIFGGLYQHHHVNLIKDFVCTRLQTLPKAAFWLDSS